MFPKRKSVCSQYHVNHLLNSKFYIARIFFSRKSSPNITSFMKKNNISTYVQLMEFYVTKVLDIVERTNKSYVIWQDPIEDGTKVSRQRVTSSLRTPLN